MFSIVVLFLLILMSGACVYYLIYKLGLFHKVGEKALKLQEEIKAESETNETKQKTEEKGRDVR